MKIYFSCDKKTGNKKCDDVYTTWIKKAKCRWKQLDNGKTRGEFDLLIVDLRLHDHAVFLNTCGWVQEVIVKSSQQKESIRPSEWLSVSVRYIVTGDCKFP